MITANGRTRNLYLSLTLARNCRSGFCARGCALSAQIDDGDFRRHRYGRSCVEVNHPAFVRDGAIDRFKHLNDAQSRIAIIERVATVTHTIHEILRLNRQCFYLFHTGRP